MTDIITYTHIQIDTSATDNYILPLAFSQNFASFWHQNLGICNHCVSLWGCCGCSLEFGSYCILGWKLKQSFLAMRHVVFRQFLFASCSQGINLLRCDPKIDLWSVCIRALQSLGTSCQVFAFHLYCLRCSHAHRSWNVTRHGIALDSGRI